MKKLLLSALLIGMLSLGLTANTEAAPHHKPYPHQPGFHMNHHDPHHIPHDIHNRGHHKHHKPVPIRKHDFRMPGVSLRR